MAPARFPVWGQQPNLGGHVNVVIARSSDGIHNTRSGIADPLRPRTHNAIVIVGINGLGEGSQRSQKGGDEYASVR